MTLKLNTLVLLTWLLLVIEVRWSQSQFVRYECVDDLEEFQTNEWSSHPDILYAETSNDLPDILQGNLDGNGIFYFVGEAAVDILKHPSHITVDPPVYLYIKYYGYFDGSDPKKGMYIIPGYGPDAPTKKLNNTYNLEWNEELIEIDASILSGLGFYIGAYSLNSDEYFLIEKIIVAQREVITSIEDIKILCPSKEIPTTTTTEPPTTTTEPPPTTPPTDFECQAEGSFADPFDCTIFHVCQYNAAGDLWDTVMTCPETTVWCQRTLECESPVDCPCTI